MTSGSASSDTKIKSFKQHDFIFFRASPSYIQSQQISPAKSTRNPKQLIPIRPSLSCVSLISWLKFLPDFLKDKGFALPQIRVHSCNSRLSQFPLPPVQVLFPIRFQFPFPLSFVSSWFHFKLSPSCIRVLSVFHPWPSHPINPRLLYCHLFP